MRPTVDEQLRGVRRLLDTVTADEHLSAASAEALAGASRALRRLEGSWSNLLPFLADDNAATAELLGALADVLPADLAGEIGTAVARIPPCPDPAVLDVVAADRHNIALRELLARAVAALPGTDVGAVARRRIADHLRRRLDTDPTFRRSARSSSEP